ncbi:MAG: phenylalanine--tRNA ligase subunit beta [Alphaproteobacteria bacterium]|nr:phenylalanine--tRNA ligase subunit beta [Alphaproteobacteria bacterium]
MKFTLNWLKTHLETTASLDEILYALTDLGLEVEGVENPADSLGDFRICRVIEAVKHPNADRLRLCRVETWPEGPDGPTEEVQVVCGAPNARTGLVGVFAPVGSYVPGIDMVLKPGVIRDVASNGMLCSERELMVSDEHDGIIELSEDAPMGALFIDYTNRNDPVIDIAITPNRPDALGVEGVARDLAARGLGTLKTPKTQAVTGSFKSKINVTIDAEVQAKACPVFMGRLIKDVKNGPSPQWLQDRLRAIGLRPISALVDVTNFFTYDRNRPLHVFDADKVQGDLRVHFASGGEGLTALDDKDYRLDAGMMAISDGQGVQSIAGIMGGVQTGCTETTQNVFVESAYWDPITIAATGRKLKINSDARYRFERGIDPAFTGEGLELATRLILEICGGQASEIVVAGNVPDVARSYRLDTDRVSSLVGMEIAAETQTATLKALGFKLKGSEVTPPTWRPDVQGEADLVEEIARIASLTKLEGRSLARETSGVTRPILTPIQRRESVVRRQIAALGYSECVTYSFIDQTAAEMFGGGQDATRLANPISSEMSHMRPNLLPGLLQAAARNQARGFADLALFEVGPAFDGGEPEDQHMEASGLSIGMNGPRDAHDTRRAVDLYDAKADAEAVLAAIGAPVKLMVRRDVPNWWHPGRAGHLSLGPKNILASFGEVHPKVLSAMGIKGPAVAFTIFVVNAPFPKSRSATRPALKISDLQSVERDFSFVVDQKVEALTLLNAAKGADKALITAASVFDVFAGEKAASQMGEGNKSIAISVRLQPKNATLTDAEIEAVSAKIIDKVAKATGGTLRT